MTTQERKAYFGHLWPDACLANEWDVKDDAQRRAVTIACMRAIRAPLSDSTSALGRDEITALFVYLRHLGDPASLEKSADWVSCQDDYKTFNRARQADWHERELYGPGKNKLARNRFGGRATAAGGPLETLDPEEVRKRHLTMASRHQKKSKDLRARKLVDGGREQLSLDKETQPGGQHAPGVTAKPATPPTTAPAPRSTGAGELVDVPF
ncbi:MAG: hypothetical protein V4773_27855 [Verrucomicrobiota bacterium]